MIYNLGSKINKYRDLKYIHTPTVAEGTVDFPTPFIHSIMSHYQATLRLQQKKIKFDVYLNK